MEAPPLGRPPPSRSEEDVRPAGAAPDGAPGSAATGCGNSGGGAAVVEGAAVPTPPPCCCCCCSGGGGCCARCPPAAGPSGGGSAAAAAKGEALDSEEGCLLSIARRTNSSRGSLTRESRALRGGGGGAQGLSSLQLTASRRPQPSYHTQADMSCAAVWRKRRSQAPNIIKGGRCFRAQTCCCCCQTLQTRPPRLAGSCGSRCAAGRARSGGW